MNTYASVSEWQTDVEQFAAVRLAPAAADIDMSGRIPAALISAAARLRLFGLESLDTEGLAPAQAYPLVMWALQRLAHVSPIFAKLVLDQNCGQVGLIRQYAVPGISASYLDAIRHGSIEAALLLTEPKGGSNPAMWTTSAAPVSGGYILSGQKDWITGANRRQLYVVIAKSSAGIGAFIVRRDRPHGGRLIVDDRKESLGMRGLGEFRVTLDEVFVPDDHTLFAPSADGMRKLMREYNLKRCGQAAIAIGIAKAALAGARRYLIQRHGRDSTRVPFQYLEFNMARALADIVGADRALPWALAESLAPAADGGAAGVVKLLSTDAALRATNLAVQACGANGVSRSLPFERFLRDARMLTFMGGTSEMMMAAIARNFESLLSDVSCWRRGERAVAEVSSSADPERHPYAVAAVATAEA